MLSEFCLRTGLLATGAYDSPVYNTCYSRGVEVIGKLIDGALRKPMSDLHSLPDLL